MLIPLLVICVWKRWYLWNVYHLLRLEISKELEPAVMPSLPEGIQVEEGVCFARVGDRELKLDIYRPPELPDHLLPVLVFIFGGGWQGGNRRQLFWQRDHLQALKGYAVVAVDYRWSQEAIFPAQIHDVKAAIRWLRKHAAEYQLDADRIACTGVSAGGHLSSLLACSAGVEELEGDVGGEALRGYSSAVQAAINYFGVTAFVELPGVSKEEAFGDLKGLCVQLFGGHPDQRAELAALASPISHISKQTPPILSIYGDRDALVPLMQLEIFDRALKASGAQHEYTVLKNAGHGYGPGFATEERVQQVTAFLDKHMPARSAELAANG